MGSVPIVDQGSDPTTSYLQKFKLYETRSNFYLIGRDKKKTFWRILKIDRSVPSDLNIFEDPTEYSKAQWHELRRRIHEGNKSTGGLKRYTACYGIVGFVRFLEPYYMLVITKRKKLGTICGHTIYSIAKSEMIPVPHYSVRPRVAFSEDEKRYKRLVGTVDLTKDFFFSYSYSIMYSLQRNLCNSNTGKSQYETMFVWNEFLTRGIRTTLKNTLWTVALVYGFFEQVSLLASGRSFLLTLIARRSRHYAGTRYLRRGVNDKGRVANDVETEQIVAEDGVDGCKMRICSVVQNRGSIPLFWSQATSLFNPQPDIKLYKKERGYEATRIHFKDLVERYGNPIIILNLIKASEKKRRETILRSEFAKAILFINRSLRVEKRLRAIHYDLTKHSKNGATDAFNQLLLFATNALNITGVFSCNVTTDKSCIGLREGDSCGLQLPNEEYKDTYKATGILILDTPMLQTGVLRTNCIDCLDRTNVGQFAFGLVSLKRQLKELLVPEWTFVDLNHRFARKLMGLYENMGDILAFQYGGSAAHDKMFSELRGQWSPSIRPHEIFKSLHRHYNNAYRDEEKQNAINVFLGHFQPRQGNPALWELDSDQHYNIGRYSTNFDSEIPRSTIRRSFSDNILFDPNTAETLNSIPKSSSQTLERCISDSKPEAKASCSRYSSAVNCGQHTENNCFCHGEYGGPSTFGNLDMDRPYSSGNSFEECSSGSWKSSDNIYTDMEIESITSTTVTESSLEFDPEKFKQSFTDSEGNSLVPGYSKEFVRWVLYGQDV